MQDQEPHNQVRALPDILYVMGTGRSGSTITEVLLANNPNIVGAGELTHIFRDGFQENVVCSCGNETSSCEFWSTVRKNCAWTDADITKAAKIFEKFSWHSNFPAICLGLGGKRSRKDFRKLNTALFTSISEISGASTVIDASKYALRALSLKRMYPGRTLILCLTRSPEGLLHSFSKPNKSEQLPKSTLSLVSYYIYVMACIRIVCWLCRSQVFHLRYEELVSDPEKTLRQIERWADIDLSASRSLLAANDHLEIGHIVTGNRLRYQKRIQFLAPKDERTIKGWQKKAAVAFMNLVRVAFRL